MFKLCSYALNHYNIKTSKIEDNKTISYLLNYRPHCMLSKTNEKNNINKTALHYCGGKLIIASENYSENKNNDSLNSKNNSYIICIKCKKCYLDECFPMICCNCNMLFYSEVIPYKTKKDNCYLATWYKYHCKNINNEKMSCIKCGYNFNQNEELFYCYECKDKYCFKCVTEHLENNSGKEKFIDQKHNLIFFKTRNKKNFENIEQYKLGKNSFVTSESLDRFKYVKCNGCGNRFSKSARYICLSCSPGKKPDDGYNDYCQNCIVHMMNEDEEGKEIQKNRDNVYDRDFFLLSDEKCYMSHDHNNHIYLMVPLSSDDQNEPYWDY